MSEDEEKDGSDERERLGRGSEANKGEDKEVDICRIFVVKVSVTRTALRMSRVLKQLFLVDPNSRYPLDYNPHGARCRIWGKVPQRCTSSFVGYTPTRRYNAKGLYFVYCSHSRMRIQPANEEMSN